MPSQQVMKDVNAQSADLIKSLTSKVLKLQENVPALIELRKRFDKEQQENAEVTDLLNEIKSLEQKKKELDDKLELENGKEKDLLRRLSQMKKELKELEKENNFKDTGTLTSDVGKLQTTLRFLQHITGMKILPVKDNILEGYVVSSNMKDVKHFQFDVSKQTPEFITDSLWSLVGSMSDASWDTVGGPAVRSKKPESNGAKKK